MEKIAEITGRQIFDSRGNPTVEADVVLTDGSMGRAASPSGASTGEREAVELRDGEVAYGGLGVLKAVDNVDLVIAPALIGRSFASQAELDKQLRDLDGTDNKARLGANALLAVSLAVAKAEAVSKGVSLYEHVGSLVGNTEFSLPMPMMNIINGGKHAANSTDIQEFMIVPNGAGSFGEAMRFGTEVFHKLGVLLEEKGYSTAVGDEGGYAPRVEGGNQEAISLILEAIERAGYKPGDDISIALDIAASELVEGDHYFLQREGRKVTADELIEWYASLTQQYPIVSIEDGLHQNDWDGWHAMTQRLEGTQIVGDDLLVTNVEFIAKGIAAQSANAVLVKPNQIGTLTETLNSVTLAQRSDWATVISHRSGETEDTTIAHLAVGTNAGQIKTGSLARSERMAKYNELLRIEEKLGKSATLSHWL